MGIKLVCLFLGAAFVSFVFKAQEQLGKVGSRRKVAASAMEEARQKRVEGRRADRESWGAHVKAAAYTIFAVATLFVIFLVLTGGGTSS